MGTIGIGGAVGRAVDWIGPSQTLAGIAWHRHTSSSVMNDGVLDASLRVGHLKNGGLLILTDHDDIAIRQAMVNRIDLELGRIWVVVRYRDLTTLNGTHIDCIGSIHTHSHARTTQMILVKGTRTT